MSICESMRSHPAGKGIPESPEVREYREDLEAVDLANSGRDAAEVDHVRDAIRAGAAYAGMGALFLLLVFLAAVLSPGAAS